MSVAALDLVTRLHRLEHMIVKTASTVVADLGTAAGRLVVAEVTAEDLRGRSKQCYRHRSVSLLN